MIVITISMVHRRSWLTGAATRYRCASGKAQRASRPATSDEGHHVAEEAGALGPTAFAALGALQSRAPIEGPGFTAAARAFMQATLAGVVRAVRRAVAPTAAAVPEEVRHAIMRAAHRPLLGVVTARTVCRVLSADWLGMTVQGDVHMASVSSERCPCLQDYSVADAQLFRVLGRPRPDDDARSLLAQNSIALAVCF